jgi:ABC-type nickel/cobalt efflux system permease component RcnA
MQADSSYGRRLGLVGLWLVLVLSSVNTFAHPMGNFSVNRYAKITVCQRSVELRYLIDMAEIPTFQEMREFSVVPRAGDPSTSAYLAREEQLLKDGLILQNDLQPVRLETVSRDVVFADGAGGLPTMKLIFVFRGTLDGPAGIHQLSYRDNNFPGRAGWKEIVGASDGLTILDSSAATSDRSSELSNYSSDPLNSPPQQLSADIRYRSTPAASVAHIAEAPVAASHRAREIAQPAATPQSFVSANPDRPKPPATERRSPSSDLAYSHTASSSASAHSPNTPRSRFTELIATQGKFSFWILLSAALIAAGLGALHALEPGHGKTIVAAYLVGSRGTAKHAVLLGLVVTAAHTAGVYLLGIVTLYASRYVVPEQLYPWLGAISGLSVAGLGIFIFLRHRSGETGEHSHAAGEQHSHWFLSMFRGSAQKNTNGPGIDATTPQDKEKALSLRELCLLGVTGGIVPCPAALVVLLSAFSLHRIGFGLFLISAFSLGLAAVLVIVGLTMVYAKQAIASKVFASKLGSYLPILSSAFMVLIGMGITLSAFSSVTLSRASMLPGKLVPFVSIILLGLFLGMRHSTDADHVVAVSTIVSRQGSIRSSATIGLLWGLGHTITIFLVGSVIIVFGVVIPPRLGLSMELCVALMLIMLGLLNLTGVMQWFRERVAGIRRSSDSLTKVTPESHSATACDATPATRPTWSAAVMKNTIGKLGIYQTIRPLAVGLIHGLAGSAAVALLVLSTIRSPLWSTAYLLIFGFGTMAGMMLMTAAISVPFVYSERRFSSISRHLTTISGLASLAFGIFLVYQIGFVDGLFLSHIHWVPQ